jgi:serine/threonine-protein kinase
MTEIAAHVGVAAGAILAGKYRVERVLGRGGMGVVVAAHHLQLDEKVALKFLLPEALQNADTVSRFAREARAAVKIKSEHVARVSDVGQLDNGSPYMVMEYLEGADLSVWLRQRGPMPVETAVDFVLQACEAIAEAHALGIVHRDLKPANLFCVTRADGHLSIKVLDFGISKVTAPGAAHEMTRTSAIVGSPSYMSPEQMQSPKNVDARTDIWSLGVILFELVTGRVPFKADAVTELAVKIVVEPAPPLRSLRADVPVELEQAIARCLAKDRAHRFQSVGELAVALKDFGSRRAQVSVERVLGTLRHAGIAVPSLDADAVTAVAPTAPPGAPVALTAASWGQSSAGTQKKGGRAALGVTAAALVVVCLAIGGALVIRRQATAAASAPSAEASGNDVAADLPVAPPPAPAASVPPAAPPAAAPSSAPAASAAPAASSPAPVTRSNPVRPPSPSPPRATARPNCTPPYVIDSAGDRQYKPECL